MLQIIREFKDLNISQLLNVYQESINGRINEEKIGRFQAERDFIDYIRDLLFYTDNAFCVVWIQDDTYVSALRMEPYQDGYLLSGLETLPDRRERGGASSLVKAVLKHMHDNENLPVYSHVHKKNVASLAVHLSCGFQLILDYGKLIDGTISGNYYTFKS